MKRHYYTLLLLILIQSCCWGTTLAVKFRKKKEDNDNDDDEELVPQVHFFIQYLGEALYNYINKPKYRFYVYMALGTSLPDEQSTIAMISTVCNVLYGIFVWLGFLFLKRDYMLLATMLTLYIGPAIVLVLIGILGASIAAFALYPVRSVLCLWTWFFLTSQIAQALGKYLGLDSDKDGDVDMLDIVHWASTTKFGKWVGLPRLYIMLNEATLDPFQEINRRLDALAERMSNMTPSNSPVKSGSGATPEYHS